MRAREIKNIELLNRIIFILKKIPWLGRKIPDTIYRYTKKKVGVAVFMSIVEVIKELMIKLFSLGMLFGVPAAFLFRKSAVGPQVYGNILLNIVIVFLGLMGGFLGSMILQVENKEDYLMIKLLRINPRRYYIEKVLRANIVYWISLFLTMYLVSFFMGMDIFQVLLFTSSVVSIRIAMEGVVLMIYSRTGRNIVREINYNYLWIYIPAIIFLVLSFGGPIKFGWMRLSTHYVSWGFFIATAICAIISGFYILGYEGYYELAREELQSDKVMSGREFVQHLSEVNQKDEIGESSHKSYTGGEGGYKYLHKLFFIRYGKVINRAFNKRCIVIGAIFILLAGGNLLDILKMDGEKFNIFIAQWGIMIITTVGIGNKFLTMLMQNVDKSLWRYKFYNTKESVVECFIIRLKMLMKSNVLLATGISAAYFVLALLLDGITELTFYNIVLMIQGSILVSISGVTTYYYMKDLYRTEVKKTYSSSVFNSIFVFITVFLKIRGINAVLLFAGITLIYAGAAVYYVKKKATAENAF